MMERKPEVRFREFDDDWVQRKLGDYCDMYNGDRSVKYPNAQDMVPEGIPFINAGDLENGRVNLATSNKITREKYEDLGGAKLQLGDILYCLRGTLGKNAYIDNFNEGTVASSLMAIRPKGIDGRYLFHILNSNIEYRQRILHDEGAAQPNLSAKNVSGFDIPIPDIEEQKQISALLDNLDNLIALHQRKHEKLLQMKKAMLAAMFPEEGENEPRVRFREYAGAWKKVAFGDLYQNVTEKNDMSFGVDRNITVAAMQFKADISISNESYLRTYNVCRLGDIAFEGHKSNEFRYGRFVENDIGDGIVSHIFSVFRPKSEYDINFWKYYINNERVMRPLLMRSTKSSTMMHDLVVNDILKEEILIPTLPEQHRIGAFFQNLESLIAVRQKKLAKLQNLKKALLQKMFV